MNKYGIFYICYNKLIEGNNDRSHMAAVGITFDELASCRYAGVDAQVTPLGFVKKLTGAELKDEKHNPRYINWDIEISAKDGKVLKLDKDGPLPNYIEILKPGQLISTYRNILDDIANLAENVIIYHKDFPFFNASCSGKLINGVNDNFKGLGNVPDEMKGELVDLVAHTLELKSNITLANDKNITIVKDGKATSDKVSKQLHTTDDVPFETDEVYAGYIQEPGLQAGYFCSLPWKMISNLSKQVGRYAVSDIYYQNKLTDKMNWSVPTTLPNIINFKIAYLISDDRRPAIDVNGEKYHIYIGGDNRRKFSGIYNEDVEKAREKQRNNEIHLLGKPSSECGYTLTYSKERYDLMDIVEEFHYEKLWDGVSEMDKTRHVIALNISNINSTSIRTILTKYGKQAMWYSPSTKETYVGDVIVARSIIPALVSFRLYDIVMELKLTLSQALNDGGHKVSSLTTRPLQNVNYYSIIEDITDVIPASGKSPETKKVNDNFTPQDYDLTFFIPNPINQKSSKVILVKDISIPNRNFINKIIVGNDIKISIMSWGISAEAFRYATIIGCAEGFAIWSPYYSNIQLNIG